MEQEKPILSEELEEQQNFFYMGIAKRLLSYLGNPYPNVNQLCFMQWLLCQAWVPYSLVIDTHLNEEEATTLYLSAQGKTTKQIARVCKVCPRQVERYRASIFKKLRCKNITQAVMKGIRLLKIKPPLTLKEDYEQDDET